MVFATKTTNFSDIFKKSFLKVFPDTVDFTTLFFIMLLSLAIGAGIFIVYRKNFTGVVYDHAFNLSLVIMTVLTAVIIVTISVNATLSLGMVGALSIVRYRTAIKNPLDLMFLFWAITSGIAVGAKYYYVAVVSFLFVALVFIILSHMNPGNRTTYILVLNFSSSTELEKAIDDILTGHKVKLRSKIIKKETTELTMEVHLKEEDTTVMNRLSLLEGIRDVTLVQYRANI